MTMIEADADVEVTKAPTVRGTLVTLLTILLASIVIVGMVAGPDQPGDRVESLTAIIKCPQCRGESIKDSSALTARTMRTMVAEQVADGQTNDEILDFFRGLYGDQAILDPGLSTSTIALWAVPALALTGGVAMVMRLSWNRARQ